MNWPRRSAICPSQWTSSETTLTGLMKGSWARSRPRWTEPPPSSMKSKTSSRPEISRSGFGHPTSSGCPELVQGRIGRSPHPPIVPSPTLSLSRRSPGYNETCDEHDHNGDVIDDVGDGARTDTNSDREESDHRAKQRECLSGHAG